MPNINIYEKDNTGRDVSALTRIFYVGASEVSDTGLTTAKAVKKDFNGCYYIPAGLSSDEIDAYLTALFPDIKKEKTVGEKPNQKVETIITIPVERPLLKEYLNMGIGIYYKYFAKFPAASALAFLKDKNAYDIKYIVTGIDYKGMTLKAADSQTTEAADSQTTKAASVEVVNIKALKEIAEARMDCVAFADVDYSAYAVTNEDGTAMMQNLKTLLNVTPVPFSSSFCATLIPNIKISDTVTYPASYAYFKALYETNKKQIKWLPIAGVNRAAIDATTDCFISKYILDKEVIKNTGVNFNGIVDVRNFGNVIWGDRTLLDLGTGESAKLKATGFLSIRCLVCDIAKIVYDASIANTYETNNDTTWINYKSLITPTLDNAIAAGVLETYDIQKKVSVEANKITCVITLYPNLPVEDFDIYINLENAEITTSENE
mgnify:CR=1 FL=1